MDDKKLKDYAEAKDFSESKDLGLEKHCLLCQEPIPRKTLYVLNEIAIENGYCSWICCAIAMDSTTIDALIKKEREKGGKNEAKL